MTLRPLLVIRLVYLVGGIVIAALALPLAVDLSGYPALVSVLPLAAGVVLSVRGWRTSVTLERDHVVVRGLIWSRTIPRAHIVAVTDHPALWWRASGAHVYTPLTMFMGAGALPMIQPYNRTCVDRLAEALSAG